MPRRRATMTRMRWPRLPAEEEMELADEDRLPWLEAVEEDEDGGGPSVAKLVAAIVIGLVAIGVIVGGVFWLGNRGGPDGGGDGELIAAAGGRLQGEARAIRAG